MSVKKTRSDFFRLYSQKAFPTFGLGLLINSRLQFAEKENDVISSVKIVVLPLALAGTRQLQPPSLLWRQEGSAQSAAQFALHFQLAGPDQTRPDSAAPTNS